MQITDASVWLRVLCSQLPCACSSMAERSLIIFMYGAAAQQAQPQPHAALDAQCNRLHTLSNGACARPSSAIAVLASCMRHANTGTRLVHTFSTGTGGGLSPCKHCCSSCPAPGRRHVLVVQVAQQRPAPVAAAARKRGADFEGPEKMEKKNRKLVLLRWSALPDFTQQHTPPVNMQHLLMARYVASSRRGGQLCSGDSPRE